MPNDPAWIGDSPDWHRMSERAKYDLAKRWGNYCDALFVQECANRRINPDVAILAPLSVLMVLK